MVWPVSGSVWKSVSWSVDHMLATSMVVGWLDCHLVCLSVDGSRLSFGLSVSHLFVCLLVCSSVWLSVGELVAYLVVRFASQLKGQSVGVSFCPSIGWFPGWCGS